MKILKGFIIAFVCLFALAAGIILYAENAFIFGSQAKASMAQEPKQEATQTYRETMSEAANEGARETLNDIRFEGWGKEQWIDNEYISTVRKYIDAYNNGEIEDASLDEYKDYIKGKFIIDQIQPWMLGGALIHFTFCNHPEKMFYAIVYSYVNVQTREVYNYECRSIRWETAAPETTKDEMIQFLKEHPEYKMW